MHYENNNISSLVLGWLSTINESAIKPDSAINYDEQTMPLLTCSKIILNTAVVRIFS